MTYHKFNIKRFSVYKNLINLLCRLFGHKISKAPTHQCCGRCGLSFSEVYFPEHDYWKEMNEWFDEKE
jgi:hypothetical protein